MLIKKEELDESLLEFTKTNCTQITEFMLKQLSEVYSCFFVGAEKKKTFKEILFHQCEYF